MDQAALKLAQAQFQIETNSGISLPVAGAIYWLVLGVLGYFLSPFEWALAAAVTSGMIFPLGILLQKSFKSPFLKAKSPLSSLALRATVSMNLLWPVHIAVMLNAVELFPLSLGIGMSLHWLIIGWGYDSRACILHVAVRTVVVSALWFLAPALSYTVLPFAVTVVYIITAVQLRAEVKNKLAATGDVTQP